MVTHLSIGSYFIYLIYFNKTRLTMNSIVLSISCCVIVTALYCDGFLMPAKRNPNHKRVVCDLEVDLDGEPCCDSPQTVDNVSTFTFYKLNHRLRIFGQFFKQCNLKRYQHFKRLVPY